MSAGQIGPVHATEAFPEEKDGIEHSEKNPESPPRSGDRFRTLNLVEARPSVDIELFPRIEEFRPIDLKQSTRRAGGDACTVGIAGAIVTLLRDVFSLGIGLSVREILFEIQFRNRVHSNRAETTAL